jgi:diguanylate cyclase (GGDEF)-like protein/PAS domain S-box-containing protein
MSTTRGRFVLPRSAAVAAAAALAAGTAAVVLGRLGQDGPARLLAATVLAAATGTAATALVLRGRSGPLRARVCWVLLAAGALAHGMPTMTGEMAAHGASSGPHVLVGLLVCGGLWLLPCPDDSRKALLRTGLDALAAGLAFAVLALEVLPPAGLTTAGGHPSRLVHPIVGVLLSTVAVAVVARARRPGGPAMPTLLLLAGGAAGLAVIDVAAHRGLSEPLGLALAAAPMLLWTIGAALRLDDTESDLARTWRERVAVLTPLTPVTAAAALLLGANVFGEPLSGVALGCAVLLAVTLTAGGVLARLDSLATERTMDSLVLKRTVSLGDREKWFRALVQNSSDVITVVDPRGTVRFQTPSVTRILGHDPAQLVGTAVTDLLRPADARRLRSALTSAARSPGRPVTLDFPVWAKDGTWCDTETTVTSLVHDPDIRGLVLNTRDVSERRRLEEKLTEQAYSDELTGLANRSYFRSKVEMALKVALAPREVAVLFLDLDGFKSVNDTQGHHVGDELLCLVAKRLSSSVRPGDVVARLGGDEFAVLVTGPTAEEGAVWVADRVRRALAAPYVLDSRELTLGGSTGLAISDTGDETADQLLRNADLAMYRAKGRRDQSFVRFEAQMHDALLARVKAESDLRQAVARGDLVLHYQPVVELLSGRIVGVEALVRWDHAELGLIPPGRFIDLAEETGLVSDIGRWALQESCRQGARWQRYAAPGGSFKVAVNMSARQLEQRLPRDVRDALGAAGLPGSALTLEMTESVLMERTDEVVELLRRIKTLGVRLAVDDFGTGYSSLSYLSRFPVDILKVDKSFVAHLGQEDGQGELVRTIVRLGESLRLDTVAEGIETVEQRKALEAMGCAFGQGFLFARPVPAPEVDALLAAQVAAAEFPVPS